MSSNQKGSTHVVVLGAGVVGLTTALKLKQQGYDVTIIAEILPTDPKTIKYTSHWAGAHHVSLAGDDERQQKMDRETFKVMWDLSANEAEGCFMRLPQAEYYYDEKEGASPLEVMPNFRYLEKHELAPRTKSGITFSTLTIDVPVYLNWLLSQFLSQGGRITRASVSHISQVLEGAYSRAPDALVICTGLGTRTLGGVEDKDMYPIRGQTVLVRAPWIKYGRTCSSADGLWTYIIPRRSGDVIVGGTKVDNDWYPHPRPEITKNILTRALELCPELARPAPTPQPSIDTTASEAALWKVPAPATDPEAPKVPTVEDVEPLIIEAGCGLRPGRKGGIRLEAEVVSIGSSGRKAALVYNYGHAGWGFQSSWGSASMALELLEGALKEVST